MLNSSVMLPCCNRKKNVEKNDRAIVESFAWNKEAIRLRGMKFDYHKQTLE